MMEQNKEFVLVPRNEFDKLETLYSTITTKYPFEIKRGLRLQKILLDYLSIEIENLTEEHPALAERLNPLLDGLLMMNEWIDEKRRSPSLSDFDNTLKEIMQNCKSAA